MIYRVQSYHSLLFWMISWGNGNHFAHRKLRFTEVKSWQSEKEVERTQVCGFEGQCPCPILCCQGWWCVSLPGPWHPALWGQWEAVSKREHGQALECLIVRRAGEVRNAHMQLKVYMKTGYRDLRNKYLTRASGREAFWTIRGMS